MKRVWTLAALALAFAVPATALQDVTVETRAASVRARLLLDDAAQQGLLPPTVEAISVSARASAAVTDDTCRAAERVVRESDLVFLERKDHLFAGIAEASNSWAAHVGLAFKGAGGKWVIYESPWGGTPQSLCAFLKDTTGRVAIGHVKGIGADAVRRVKAWATHPANLRKPYDNGFDFDDKEGLYCSKFVYLAFRAAGLTVGRIQTFDDIFKEFKGGWVRKQVLLLKFNYFFGEEHDLPEIPWTRRAVTPGSQLADPGLEIVLGRR
ncbi:MAG: hypothetical protein HY078_16135 [Elusimicrobia bacterium]|nr:hypothetical protein [Elusimicrobiota bacterium]